MGQEVVLNQDFGAWANYENNDVLVMNNHTEGCGLVIAFAEREPKIYAFHWGGFALDDEDMIRRFKNKCLDGNDNVIKIVVLSNSFKSDKEKIQNIKAVRCLSSYFHGVEVSYYTNRDGQNNLHASIDTGGNITSLIKMEKVEI